MTQALPTGEYEEVPLPDIHDERMGVFREKLRTFTDHESYFPKATICVPEVLHDQFDYAPIKKGQFGPELLAGETSRQVSNCSPISGVWKVRCITSST